MTAPAAVFPDGLSICGVCNLVPVVVEGTLCAGCEQAALEWAGLAEECDPRTCQHAEDSDAA